MSDDVGCELTESGGCGSGVVFVADDDGEMDEDDQEEG